MLLRHSISFAGRIPTIVSLALLLSLSFVVILTPIAQQSSHTLFLRKRDMSSVLESRQQSGGTSPAVSSPASSPPAQQATSAATSSPATSQAAKPTSTQDETTVAQTTSRAQTTQQQQQQQQQQTTAASTQTTQAQATSATSVAAANVSTATVLTTSRTTVADISTSTAKTSSTSSGTSGNGGAAPASGSKGNQKPGETVKADDVSGVAATGFWANKGAVAGTFTILVLFLILGFFIVGSKITRRRNYRRRHRRHQEAREKARPKAEGMAEKQPTVPSVGVFNGATNAVEDPEPGMADLTAQVPMSAYPTHEVHYGGHHGQYQMYQNQQYHTGYPIHGGYYQGQHAPAEDAYDAYGGFEAPSAPEQQPYPQVHVTEHSSYAPAHPYSDPRHSTPLNQAPPVQAAHYNPAHEQYYENAQSGHAL